MIRISVSVLSITLFLALITPICSTNMFWTQVRRQDLNEDAPHPLGIGVHLFLLLLLLIIIFINFFCISSHWCAKNGKTNPIAHNIVSHLPSSSGVHCASERDVPCPERDTTPAAAPGEISLLSLWCPCPPGQWRQHCPQLWDREGTPGAEND